MNKAPLQVASLVFACALLLSGAPHSSASGGPIPPIPVVAVKGGCFQMGDTFGGGGQDEKPVHQVCVDDFSMGKYEVTQEQWQAVMGTNPSQFALGGQYPVERVSWHDAQLFILRLNRLGDMKWRLPTEAEWEYAARSGGKKQRFAGAGEGENPDEYAWYAANSGMKTHPVGTRKPNDLGLYDMSGNVWEWVRDRYDREYYRQSASRNPTGDPFGVNRIMRGGAAVESQGYLRTSYRDYVAPNMRGDLFGLRLVLQGGS
jgi:formylglycine-generating enzyme required for sulfatase activity